MMEIDPPLHFPTKEDEVQYWMDIAHQMYQSKEEIEREMAEYQENSQIYEKELETSFEQTDKRNRDLCHRNGKLQSDNEHLKRRLNQQIVAYSKLQTENQDLNRSNDQLVTYVRKLEQKNDDLERSNRESKMAEEEIEMQFNTVIEKLALLETDVDEKEGLKIIVQRLKDENKDLKQQIQVDIRQHDGIKDSVATAIRNSFRLQNRRKSLTNFTYSSMKEEAHNNSSRKQSNDMFKYVRELEQKIESLENTEKVSKVAEEELKSKFNMAAEKIGLLETELGEKENFKATIQQLRDENRDLSQEVEVRLRTHKGKTMDRARPHSLTNKLQEDKQRSSTTIRASRHTENRVKKVKEDEKHNQNLTWFLKRLRYSQPNWMRKKEHN